MLKSRPYNKHRPLAEHLNKVWEEETISETWKRCFITELSKKDDFSLHGSCRGISRIAEAGKIFVRVHRQRLKLAIDKIPKKSKLYSEQEEDSQIISSY